MPEFQPALGARVSNTRISVVIPANNEEGRIRSAIAAVHACLTQAGYDVEIVVVNDGSTDETAQETRRASGGACCASC